MLEQKIKHLIDKNNEEMDPLIKQLLSKIDKGKLFYHNGILFKQLKNGKVKEFGGFNKFDGYISISANVNDKKQYTFAHRLIWNYFNGPIPYGMQINHKNGVKFDNRIENLELVTPSENVTHAYKTNLQTRRGERNKRAKLTYKQVDEIRSLEGLEVAKDVAEKFNITKTSVGRIWRGKAWKNGFNKESDLRIQIGKIETKFQGKADYYHRKAEYYFVNGDKELAAKIDSEAHIFEVFALELRMILK